MRDQQATHDADAVATDSQVRQVISSLRHAPLAPTKSTEDRATAVNQLESTLNRTDSQDFHARAKRLAVGFENGRLYLQLNGTDQDLVAAGTTFWLTKLICLIPGLGPVACVAAQALITVAATFLSRHGRCPNDREIRIFAGGAGRCL